MLACQRDLFDLADDVVYLNCAYTAPLLKAAVEAGEAAVRQKSRPWGITSEDFFQSIEVNRALFAQLIGAVPSHVAIIPAVSYGVALAAKNLPLIEGQNIVLLDEQFPSNVYAWQRVAAAKSASITTVPRPSDGDWTPAVLEAIDSRTAIAALPNCHWTDGTLLDLVAIGAKCREVGAALVVDGTQSLGVLPFDVSAVQPAFLITTAHKWLLGPYSFGFCYVAPEWCEGTPLEENWLNREGSEDFSRLVAYRDSYQPGARRYDVGEASNFILAPIAAAALQQLLAWGIPEIQKTLKAMTDQIAGKAVQLGFQVAPAQNRAAHMLGLALPNGLPPGLAAALAARKVYVSVRGNSIRVAPHLYNSDEDIERMFKALAEVIG